MPEHKVKTYIYRKREKLGRIELPLKSYYTLRQSHWAEMRDKKFVLNSVALRILRKSYKHLKLTFQEVTQIKRGVLFDAQLLTPKKTSPQSYRYFEGDVYRYLLNFSAPRWLEFDDQLKERPKESIWFEGQRLLLRRLVNRQQQLMATFTAETFITNKNIYSVLARAAAPNLLAILGVLNSRLISYLYLNQITQAAKDDFPQVTIKDILALPFPDFSKIPTRHAQIVALVEQMLTLRQRQAATPSATLQEQLQRQINMTDERIDRLVYELYALSEEEIKAVEGKEI